MSKEEREQLIAIMSHFETRSNKNILFLMEMSFKAGRGKIHYSFQSFIEYIKRDLLNL
jgi:hypothetical protein